MIGPEDELVRPARGPGFGEAVTFAWGDAEQELFGTARLGLSPGEPASVTGLSLLFGDGKPVATVTEQADVHSPDWRQLSAGSLSTATLTPLERWEIALVAPEGGFELELFALCAPAELGEGSAAARASGLHGYEQLCAVRGTVRVGEEAFTVDCLGQRGHQWGVPDWERLALTRTVSAWLEPDLAVGLSAVREAGAEDHEEEELSAWVVQPVAADAEKAARPAPTPVAEPRLSTVYDGEGRQRRAGLELWVGAEDDFPRRAAGDAVCGASLALGRLRLDAAFFRWRMEGHAGVGRYEVLRRA